MIISKIIGGLGNQMFQYAAARALSARLSAPLRLDVSAFTGYELHHGFELPRVFACDPELATEIELQEMLGWRASPFAQRVLRRSGLRRMLQGDRMVLEPHLHYWPGISDVADNSYLSGYWQSERYFSDASPAIRSDFTFRPAMSEQNSALAEQIAQTMAVSLHVRRGDYVSDPKTNATLGLCSLEYYRAAISHIAQQIDHPEFFVFSDDIPWVKAHLKIDFRCCFVDHNRGVESFNDMRLMSLCRHHIIANSSFSWWGAWLNPDAGKIVIAPKKWFANDSPTEDLLPQDWTVL